MTFFPSASKTKALVSPLPLEFRTVKGCPFSYSRVSSSADSRAADLGVTSFPPVSSR